jgi:hypothetical protein
MKSVIVKEGSAANGDGHGSYAARRRNLACRPLALGRTSWRTRKPAARRRLISLPELDGPTDESDALLIA